MKMFSFTTIWSSVDFLLFRVTTKSHFEIPGLVDCSIKDVKRRLIFTIHFYCLFEWSKKLSYIFYLSNKMD